MNNHKFLFAKNEVQQHNSQKRPFFVPFFCKLTSIKTCNIMMSYITGKLFFLISAMQKIPPELFITVKNYINITSFKMKGSPDLGRAVGENFAKMLARHFTWGSCSRYYSYFLDKGIPVWVLFSRGGNFHEDQSAKNAKITPTRKIPCLQ